MSTQAKVDTTIVEELDERAAALYKNAIVIDATSPILDREEEWPKWHRGGVTAVMATVASNEDSAGAIHEIGAWFERIRKNHGRLLHATSVADIQRAKAEGKLAVVFHFQNARPIGYDLSLVEVYQRLGVRAIQLTYNVKSPVGDGCSERTDGGLSDLGVAIVAEMNRVGMVVDLSHTGFQTTMDAMEASTAPVIFSHSNAKAICDHPRNLTDEQIKAAAQKGGVIGLNGYPAFIRSDTNRPALEDLLVHLDHIANLVGIDHVGLGLDYFSTDESGYQQYIASGVWKPEFYPPPPYYYPAGIDDASMLPNLAPALLRRGYSPQESAKVLGGNFMRVFKEIWQQ
jgi:membrane dipeptidase